MNLYTFRIDWSEDDIEDSVEAETLDQAFEVIKDYYPNFNFKLIRTKTLYLYE